MKLIIAVDKIDFGVNQDVDKLIPANLFIDSGQGERPDMLDHSPNALHSVPSYRGSLPIFRASRYFRFEPARLRDNAFSLFTVDPNSFSKISRSDRV